ncbi:MAG: dephospho-CoA kinase [Alphaproteobacteria bacterium]|nr:dephospho-CoA kinase [Alphaproteobacteria bacterium]
MTSSKMRVVGLTGGIGMGKSTAAKVLRGMGFPIYHADRAVHALLRKGGKGVKPVAKLFPETLRRGAIDRKQLGRIVFSQPQKLKKLERILHPLVQGIERDFLRKARQGKVRAVILEIPLLFETGAEKRCDAVLCVNAPPQVQKARVMARPGMTEARFKAILKRQMSYGQKCKKADYVIPTGKGLAVTRQHLRRAMKKILEA